MHDSTTARPGIDREAQIMTAHLIRGHQALRASAARAAAATRSERGDVPGWVLITLMTAALVVGLWAIAGDQLQTIFEDALSGVTGPDDPR